MKRLLACVAMCTITSLGWAQTHLTPNHLGNGKLPGTYSDLVFTLSNGNWTPEIQLPASGTDKASIRIISDASYVTQVLQTNSDVPLAAMVVARGQSLQYEYSAPRNRWEIVAPTFWGGGDGKLMMLPVSNERVVRARMSDGAWAASLRLPPSAIDGALVLVDSSATWSSRVDSANVLHASTMPLRTNDAYAFVFNGRLGKWVLHKGPETMLTRAGLIKGGMPAPVTALTRFNISAGGALGSISLPARAGDRDRIIVTSSADVRTTISDALVQDGGTKTIGKGQSYEFMWIAERGRWALMQAPRTQVLAKQIVGVNMSATQTPVTELLVWEGNWKPSVGLPQSARAGDRVVVKSAAADSFRVPVSPSLHYIVSKDEEVSFIYTGKRGSPWMRETHTIPILLAYGQGVAARLGASAARARQLESLRLTNEALENSGAKFRFKAANLIEVPNLGIDLESAVAKGRDDATIQGERNRVRADAVYYDGIESGCGLAWVNRLPNSYSMFATGSLDCGTTVMRHELGHNMGLSHGNGVVSTVMNNNSVPYFSTPRRFDATLRVPMGHGAIEPDEVTLMDGNAPAVSGFR